MGSILKLNKIYLEYSWSEEKNAYFIVNIFLNLNYPDI